MSTVQVVVILVVFLVVAYFVGRILGVIEESRTKSLNERTWDPLLALMEGSGQLQGNRMTGLYAGRAFEARRGEKVPADTGTGYNFELAVVSQVGGQDWQVEYGQTLVVVGKVQGQIKSKDEVLIQQLRSNGVIEHIDRIRSDRVKYVRFEKKQNRIVYNEDVRPQLVPSPERFKGQLELLAYLAELNEQVNRGCRNA